MLERQILIVDDEDRFRMSLAEAIEISSTGVTVLQAVDSTQALELLRSYDVCLVVSDLNVSIVNGYRLLTELNSREVRLPIIVITSSGESELRERMLQHEVIACLEKPVVLKCVFELTSLQQKPLEWNSSSCFYAGLGPAARPLDIHSSGLCQQKPLEWNSSSYFYAGLGPVA